jgi:hypothetical protein
MAYANGVFASANVFDLSGSQCFRAFAAAALLAYANVLKTGESCPGSS